MAKWEYRTLNVRVAPDNTCLWRIDWTDGTQSKDSEVWSYLNDLGESEWELVAVIPRIGSTYGNIHYYSAEGLHSVETEGVLLLFKRPKE